GGGEVGGNIADCAKDVGHHLDGEQQGQDLERQAHDDGDGRDGGEEADLSRQADGADADRQGRDAAGDEYARGQRNAVQVRHVDADRQVGDRGGDAEHGHGQRQHQAGGGGGDAEPVARALHHHRQAGQRRLGGEGDDLGG